MLKFATAAAVALGLMATTAAKAESVLQEINRPREQNRWRR